MKDKLMENKIKEILTDLAYKAWYMGEREHNVHLYVPKILSLLTSEVEKERERLLKEVEEKVIGKYEEKVKAKSSEDMINNAWKIARNALREKQRKALSDIGGKDEK